MAAAVGKLARRGGTGGVVASKGSCTLAEGGGKDGTIGGAIRYPEEALGDARDDTGGVDLSMVAINSMVVRSIRGSNILDTFSRKPDRSNKAGRSS